MTATVRPASMTSGRSPCGRVRIGDAPGRGATDRVVEVPPVPLDSAGNWRQLTVADGAPRRRESVQWTKPTRGGRVVAAAAGVVVVAVGGWCWLSRHPGRPKQG